MSKSTKSKRTKKMDVLFIIDATGSMAKTIQAAHDKAEDLAFDLNVTNRTASFKFACICYRDPVDSPSDEHQVFDFDPEIENLATFLEDIKASGGGDGPEDYVGALNKAFDELSWRVDDDDEKAKDDKNKKYKNKKAIIWIADAPAHGKRYCGKTNHQEEEPKLEPLVVRLAKEKFYFVGISLNGGADRTFREMKKIFEDNYEIEAGKGIPFKIVYFTREKGDEIDRIAETMAESTKGIVSEALFE